MRRLWSEVHKRQLMRRVWVALAEAQQAAGLVTAGQLAELKAHQDDIDIPRAQEIELETRHDVMAEIRVYAEQCPQAGGVIHWGATSADINDNVYALRLRDSLALLQEGLMGLLNDLAARIEETAGWPVMGYTHIQPAEPTTLGYRLAVYAQDLLADYEDLARLRGSLRGKGFKGAVGTQASFAELLAGTGMSPQEMETRAMEILELSAFPITTQTYTRQQDLRLMHGLSGLAASLHKFALDFRVLQSPPFGEWAEPFGQGQVGSSAMPFKRNPINAENICSLARYVAALPAVAWDNASQAILERSLDDSANRRLVLAEAFLAADELVRRSGRLVAEMRFDRESMARNLAVYAPFAATEKVLMALVRRGASRQVGHDWLREASLQAWEAVRAGQPNPLADLVAADPRLRPFLSPVEIKALMTAEGHLGTAVDRARTLAADVRRTLSANM